MAAAGTQDVDDIIVCLMSMGFDIKDCQDAIQFGNITVESAVNWIVAGKPGFKANSIVGDQGTPSLKLRSTQSEFENTSSSNAFVKPIPIQQSEASAATSSISQSESMQEETDQSGSLVVSRMHLNDEQRKVKAGFEQKQRDEAKKSALMEKKRHKEDHARVLKEIAEDREKKKLIHHAPSKQPRTSEVTTSAPGPPADTGKVDKDAEPSADRKDTPASCLLQIRLPDGRSLRQSFPATATLRDVWNFTSNHVPSIVGFCFIQPFPRHEFSREEMLSSLVDLGLTPTGSLVLQKKQEKPAEDVPASIAENVEENSTPNQEVTGAPSQGHIHDASPLYRWGRGMALDQDQPQDNAGGAAEAPMEEEMEGMDVPEEGPNLDDMPMFPPGGMPPGLPGAAQGFPGMPQFGQQIGGGLNMAGGADMMGMMGHHGGQVFGGVGQRLVPAGHPEGNENYQQRSVREMALERAQARLAQPVEPMVGSGPRHPSSAQPAVPTLLLCCLRHVTHRLNDPRNQILSLSGVSEDMAQVILSHLMKEKQLKPKTLNAFLPCFLRRLILDCYPYTTNELLTAIRLHTNLVQLSLNACPLITDAGLQCLTNLKKLKSLNLSSCKQLSNKCAPLLTCLPNLVSLNVEDTGITDQGLVQFLSSNPQHLQHLNLNRTGITHFVIPQLQGVTGLKSLYLEDTKVVSLSGVQELRQLETLNVARTGVVTESLLCLVDHPSLTSLNVSNTDNINGDDALKHLSGVKLQVLTLPSRHTTTNRGMSHLTNLPLVALDLTNYINVGDDGMEHIGKLHSLKKLLLCNTKVTDVGMLFLQGLSQLEVLHLDRTAVTDEGASAIQAFTNLEDLSLSSTSVSSRLLLSGCLNSCVHLTKLNLSRTLVTAKGLKCLSLPSLSQLSLDHTRVLPDIREILAQGCPSLTQVSLRNLAPVSRDDDDPDMET